MLLKVFTAAALIVAGTSATAAPRFPALVPQVVPPTLVPEPGVVGTVPEPGTWVMMIAGFGLVGAMRRRNRSVAA